MVRRIHASDGGADPGVPDRFLAINGTSRKEVLAEIAHELRGTVIGSDTSVLATEGVGRSGTSTSGRPRILVFTALPIEYGSVLQHLNDISIHDANRGWEAGSFVASGNLPCEVLAIETGSENARAAAVVSAALQSYEPDIAIYTGIAGGLATKGLTHGEVIVPPFVHHYGAGKDQTEIDGFGQRPRTRYVSKRMRVVAQRVARRGTWHKRIKDQKGIRTVPKVRLEPMASGDLLLKSTTSSSYRILRSSYEDAVAIDMESGGFLASADEFPNVQVAAVRSVSDLLDDKDSVTDAHHQPIAAAHAAAFAFELVSEAVTSASSNAPQGREAA